MAFTATHDRLMYRVLGSFKSYEGIWICQFSGAALRQDEKYNQENVQLAFVTIQTAILTAVALIL